MAESRGQFGVLSKDLWRLIFIYYLPLADVVNAKRWNKGFRELLAGCDELLWQKRIDWHFPVLMAGVPAFRKNQTAYDRFKIIYEREYSRLNPRERKIITALKENDVAVLQKMVLTQKDLAFMMDASEYANACLVKQMKPYTRQFLFENVVLKNLSHQIKAKKFLWAILLKQHQYVRELIEDRSCLRASYQPGSSDNPDYPKHLAAMVGDSETSKLLVTYDATTPAAGVASETELCRAIRYHHTEFAKGILTEIKSDEQLQKMNVQLAVRIAASCGNLDSLEALLSVATDINKYPSMITLDLKELMFAAIDSGEAAVIDKIYEHFHESYTEEIVAEVLEDAVRRGSNILFLQSLINKMNPEKLASLNQVFLDSMSLYDVDTISLFIDKGIKFSQSSVLFPTLLIKAIENDRLDFFKKIFEEVLTQFPDLIYKLCDERHILLLAADAGRKEIVEYLIQKGVPLGGSLPLRSALVNGHVDIVELLIKNGTKIDFIKENIYELLKKICENNAVNAFQYLRKAFLNEWSIVNIPHIFEELFGFAVNAGHVEMVEALLALNVSPSLKDKTTYEALRGAMRLGTKNMDIIKLLKQNGTAFALLKLEKNELNDSLLDAVNKMNVGMINTLIILGADVNVRYKDGMNLLMKALRSYGDEETRQKVVMCLLDNGIELTAANKLGLTALHIAAEKHDASLFGLLLGHGADIYAIHVARTHMGETKRSPLEEAYLSLRGDFEEFRPILEVFIQQLDKDELHNYCEFLVVHSESDLINLLNRYAGVQAIPTLLQFALQNKLIEVRQLVEKNADVINATYRGVSCLDFALQHDLIRPACAMVKLDESSITQKSYDAEFKKKTPDYRKLRVMEIVLLKHYIKIRGAPDAPERMTLFRRKKGIEIGDTKTNKIAAAQKRLQQLLGGAVDYTPVDMKALTKGDLGDISKFRQRM